MCDVPFVNKRKLVIGGMSVQLTWTVTGVLSVFLVPAR